jgi:hypothetical protein
MEDKPREFKVLATIKKAYWVDDIKRYVIPHMNFEEKVVATINEPEPYDKPFVCETTNLEFRIYKLTSVVNVFAFEAFDNVVITKIV